MNAVPQPAEPFVLRSDSDGVCRLTLNRPQQFNLLTGEMIDALQAQFDALAGDARTRVVVLTGAGKGFCAGHDLKEIRDLGEQARIEALFERCSRMMVSITQLPQPVIARVQGTAAAAGCQLVAQCDLAVAVDSAKFTTPGVNWGFFCSTPGVALARNLPRKRAMELLLTGDLIDAATALQWGLLNRVVAASDLDAAVDALVQKIAAKPHATIAAGKRAFYRQAESSLPDAYALAGRTIAASFVHEEGREGLDAFIDKRPPRWTR
jgi:enoyl-CoA hydratase/carnithine racemase